MQKNFLILAALFGASGVALGAFGAHGLQKITSDENIIHGYLTGVQYQLYHALALLIIALLHEKLSGKWIRWSGNFFITGILLFSGSLYGLTALKIAESPAVKLIGPVTPLGGVFLIAGWLFLFVAALGKKSS